MRSRLSRGARDHQKVGRPPGGAPLPAGRWPAARAAPIIQDREPMPAHRRRASWRRYAAAVVCALLAHGFALYVLVVTHWLSSLLPDENATSEPALVEAEPF